MPKTNIHRKIAKSNPNPKYRVDLDPERMEVLRRIRQKMSDPEIIITAEMIAAEYGCTPDNIRQALGRRAYVSLDKYLTIENIVDNLMEQAHE